MCEEFELEKNICQESAFLQLFEILPIRPQFSLITLSRISVYFPTPKYSDVYMYHAAAS